MKQKHFSIYFLFLLTLLVVGCEDKKDDDMPPPVITELENNYTVLAEDELLLSPSVSNNANATYSWILDGLEVATTPSYSFQSSEISSYTLIFRVNTDGGTAEKKISINVVERESAPIISDIAEKYILKVGEDLHLAPSILSVSEVTYSWVLDGKVVANSENYTFSTLEVGAYTLLLQATNKEGTTDLEISIIAKAELLRVETSAYVLTTIETPEYFTNLENLKWTVLNSPSPLYRLSFSNTSSPIFVAAQDGVYTLQVTDGENTDDVIINVKKQATKLSAYIANVFDYLPAPGQFVNTLPDYVEGDTHADMVKKAREWLIGEDAWMITLGGWGGYVTFGFDHTIVNVPGRRDFRINGNAFGAAMGRPGAPFGGSCEPGIIMVAYDRNKNGIPDDDEWYEIKGSSNFSAENEPWYTIAKENGNDTRVFRDYEMTYYKPTRETADVIGEPDNPLAFVSIHDYIRWQDNKSNSGYKVKNVYHSQSYYPAWVKENSLTFNGIRLPENGINEGKYVPGVNDDNVYYVLYGFSYGYVDNHPNMDDGSAIDIDWAIDKDGNKANLPGIDFVKVYGGVNQENGWLGECSTEVARAEDLHMLGRNIDSK